MVGPASGLVRLLGGVGQLVLATACADDDKGAAGRVASIHLAFERLKPGVELRASATAEAYLATGTIVGVAEPTKTRPAQHPEGKEILYFNYITRAADGSFNLNVGFVEAVP